MTSASTAGNRHPAFTAHVLGLLTLLLVISTTIWTSGLTADASPVDVGTVAEQIDRALPDTTDADVAAAVERELNAAVGVSADSIDVTSRDGIVTLRGTVSNILSEDRAIRIAMMVRGVRSVVDHLIVAPGDHTDATIEGEVREVLNVNPAVAMQEISVSVNDGVVLLDGTVASWQEKQLLTRLVKRVRGVRGVENTIDVTYAAERPDAEIADDVAHALRWDARLGHAPIDVAVEDGVVMLSGSVGSAFAKRLAIDRARVSGVTNVTADALEVRGWDRDDALRRNAVADTSDVQVRRAVEAALRQDPRTAPFAIEVEADDGVAVLSGTVDNLKARRAAAQTASHTLGVQAVRNTLTVEPTTSVSDTDLKFDVAEALAVNPYTDRLEISILVDDGAVTLNGQADTYFEKWETGNVVAHVPGVTGVTNALDVDLDQPTYESRFYDWDPVYTDYDYRYGYEADYPVSDDALRESIAREMRWSPSLDRSEITMSIEDGVVTLRGTIDSWYARARATEEAYEGGAASVVNSLEVVR